MVFEKGKNDHINIAIHLCGLHRVAFLNIPMNGKPSKGQGDKVRLNGARKYCPKCARFHTNITKLPLKTFSPLRKYSILNQFIKISYINCNVKNNSLLLKSAFTLIKFLKKMLNMEKKRFL